VHGAERLVYWAFYPVFLQDEKPFDFVRCPVMVAEKSDLCEVLACLVCFWPKLGNEHTCEHK